ncbi:MAG: hypothetical protein J0G95_04420 [Rhizobiales bacterium]|nr:hypothetical protein [Hyphomicrobiales bacterium]
MSANRGGGIWLPGAMPVFLPFIDLHQSAACVTSVLYRLAICCNNFGAMHLFYLHDIDAEQFLFFLML